MLVLAGVDGALLAAAALLLTPPPPTMTTLTKGEASGDGLAKSLPGSVIVVVADATPACTQSPQNALPDGEEVAAEEVGMATADAPGTGTSTVVATAAARAEGSARSAPVRRTTLRAVLGGRVMQLLCCAGFLFGFGAWINVVHVVRMVSTAGFERLGSMLALSRCPAASQDTPHDPHVALADTSSLHGSRELGSESCS